ncbi:MAG: PQQ-binding-like beta-propeller repeat protein [Bacillota bacterium]|nr:PQQ-binding-like beta-propeller repeat protein [Bacillota bacterium]
MDKKNFYYYKKSRYGSSKSKQQKKRGPSLVFAMLAVILVLIGVGTWLVITYVFNGGSVLPVASLPVAGSPTPSASETPTPSPSPTPSPTPSGVSLLPAGLVASPTGDSEPSKYGFTTSIQVDNQPVDSYQRPQSVSFGTGEEYTDLEGVITFRGNNYRTAPSYGTADIKEGKLEIAWLKKIGGIDKWIGAGWTGQPLIVKWPDALKNQMNINDDKKAKANLVEVIYAPLDGKIYFLDLEDGTATRNTITTGVVQKGTSSLDPRGYPILYCGQGYPTANGKSVPVNFRMFNLLDQTLAFQFGGKDPFAYRKSWAAFDSSSLVDGKTDTFIEPGECGVLYTFHLNTQYDQSAGTLTISPDHKAKYRYTAPGYSDSSGSTKWYGMEDSAVTFRNYVYFTDNGGHLQCVDINTFQLVWVIDVTDDTDSTMCLEESPEDGTAYLYTACEVDDKTNKGSQKGPSIIRKVDALTGKVMWSKEYLCYTLTGNPAGALASPVLGKKDISNLIIYTLANYGTKGGGLTVALDRKTGEEVWTLDIGRYTWSSPVDVYTPEGKSYIVQCTNKGDVFLIEGTTGKIVDTCNVGETSIEASPAVYNDMIVIGTRSTQKIYGIKIK